MPWKLVCDLIYYYCYYISDIGHSPNYIALGSPKTHKMN